MRKNLFFIIALGFIVFSFVIGFAISDKQPKDIVEGISGVMSYTAFDNGDGNYLYLDVSEEYDTDGDGVILNDKDVWVSGFDENVLDTLAGLKVGDWFYAKDLWKADESLESGINHYYILEFYEIRKK